MTPSIFGTPHSEENDSPLRNAYAHQIWSEEPVSKMLLVAAGVKSHARVSQGQPEVKLLRNPLYGHQIWLQESLNRV